jgi:WD40 repeat protein
LLTAGQTDGCIFQWTFAFDEGEDSAEEAEAAAAAAEPEEPPEVDPEEYQIPVDSCDDEDLVETAASAADAPSLAIDYSAADAFTTTLLPADAAESIPARDLPTADLSLKWIHGVSAQSTRNATSYNANGDLVYPVASTVVVLNKANMTQKHFLGHKNAVTALTLHPNKKLAASAGGGSVLVWDTLSATSKKVFRHANDASALAFSADGSLLAVASTDAQHTISVYAWSDGTLKCSAPTGSAKLLSLSFDKSGDALVAGGNKAFSVCSISGKNLSVKRGQFGSALGGRKKITCVSWCGGDFVLGTADGKLFRLEGGRKLAGEVAIFEKGHVNCLTALPAPSDPEASGYAAMLVAGDLGVVKLLDESLGEMKVFDLKTIFKSAKSYKCSSVCFNKDQRKVMVSTKGSEIYEFTNPAGGEEENQPTDVNDGPLTTGHSSDQLWGLAAHPVKNEVATCGDDKMVSFWDLDENKVSRSIAVGDFARSCDYSPTGYLLAVGLGGIRGGGVPGSWEKPVPADASAAEAEAEGDDAIAALKAESGATAEGAPSDPWLATLYAKGISARSQEGSVVILSLLEDDVRIVKTNQDAKGYICDVKFSPDGNILAAASMDSSVYVYDCLQDFKLKNKCSADGGLPVIHLNWSSDSSLFMAAAMRTSTTQIKYYLESNASELEEDSEEVSNATWASWTSVGGRAVKGCYRKGAADPSSLTSVCRSGSGSLVASGDDSGSLRLHKYPALEVGAAYKSFGAHSGGGVGIGKVVFGMGDKYVVTVGAADRSVCVWDVVQNDAEDAGEKEYGLSDDSDYVKLAPVEEPEEDATVTTADDGEEKKEEAEPQELLWADKLAGSEATPAAVEDKYEISAVYGVDSAAGVCYSAAGDAVYSSGAASVVYSSSQKKFVVYNGSSGGINCLSTSSDGKFGLVGDSAGGVNVFATATGAGCCSLSGAGDAGVGCVGWSPDGSMCASVGKDKDHTLTVWSSPSGTWRDGEKYAESMNVASNVSFVCFTGKSASSDGPHLITGGFNHIMFWTFKNGNVMSKKGTFGTEGSIQPLTCGAMLGEGSFASGTVGGSIFQWDIESGTVVKKVTAHVSSVTSLSAVQGGGLVSSGKDGMVKQWNLELMNVNAFDVGGVALGAACDLKSTKLLACVSTGELKEIVVDSGFIGTVVSGAKSVWCRGDKEGGPKRPGAAGGLSKVAALSGGKCAVGGADGVVRLYGAQGGAMPMSTYDCGTGIGAIAANKDGVIAVALGTGLEGETIEGTVLFLDGNTLDGKGKVQQDCVAPTCMVFGADSLCYMGGADGVVRVFDSASGEFKFSVNEKMKSGVMGVDVSKDGSVVAIAGSGGEMKYFTVKGAEKQAADVGSVEWVNGSMPFRADLMGVDGLCCSGGGFYGTASGGVGVIGGDAARAAHSGNVGGLVGGQDGEVYSSSGANAGVFRWTKV